MLINGGRFVKMRYDPAGSRQMFPELTGLIKLP